MRWRMTLFFRFTSPIFKKRLKRLKARDPPDLLFDAICMAASKKKLPPYVYNNSLLRPPSQRIKKQNRHKKQKYGTSSAPIASPKIKQERRMIFKKESTTHSSSPARFKRSISPADSPRRSHHSSSSSSSPSSSPSSSSSSSPQQAPTVAQPSPSSSSSTSSSSLSPSPSSSSTTSSSSPPKSFTSDTQHVSSPNKSMKQEALDRPGVDSDSVMETSDEEEDEETLTTGAHYLNQQSGAKGSASVMDYTSSPLPPLLNLTPAFQPAFGRFSPDTRTFVTPVRPAAVNFVSPVLKPATAERQGMSPLMKGDLSPINELGRYSAFKSPERTRGFSAKEQISTIQLPASRDLSKPKLDRAMSDNSSTPGEGALILSTLSQLTARS
eukprot:TRINITY_DN2896_c0_g1_i1.p1 TRINITY_DN2896_c0_g1~~TRINITY_DN2896_c0_g1_i1.p1  ORF type:complete len:382 (+),score=68.95 TRINITY_DN2896_c0_g1_i1:392-1537(+)